MKLTTYPI